MDRSYQEALELVSELAARYQLTSLLPLLEICKQAENRTGLSIAVMGRFKAGKSSFLNHLIGRDVLPVGVVPVTSVITEVAYGPHDNAMIHFQGGHDVPVRFEELGQFVSETHNPMNRKHVDSVSVRVSALSQWRDLRFIDTPGLESAFAHNSETSLNWAPNMDIALVAIGVDPPLSERDIELIQTLFRYTPRLVILLTKADILEPPQLREVIDYMRAQLRTKFGQELPIYPYSTRPGFEEMSRNLEDRLLRPATSDIVTERRAISRRKLATLLSDGEQYLALTLKSADMLETERADLHAQLSAERLSLDDTRLELQLIARHAIARTRSSIEKALAPHENPVRQRLLQAFEEYSPQLPGAFAKLIDAFSDWLHAALTSELSTLSATKRPEFLGPLVEVQRQYQRVLQNFRDRLSHRTFSLYGVPLKTTEAEISADPPKTPDVSIGRAFDHNWELLSPVLPMGLLRSAVFTRFRRKIEDETFKNLSRLTAQWEEIVTGAILSMQREAEKRLSELLATVQGLVSASKDSGPQIRTDLERLRALGHVGQQDTESMEHQS